jgi:hypothetical protein
LAQALVQANRELIRDPRLCLINYYIDSVPAGDAARHERIYACAELSFF